ncbi:GNAT family N-acetyltransferase [Namhaeicola litoreus]|uniref:GNAT family N-acetyltransferase n=1 Tax=Namhaeicola litoreus TaxID=1052145 RepID=A0ABW3XZ88_9FLAO
MEIKSLEKVNSKDILNVFNASFSDYFVPFKLTEEQLMSKMRADKIDLTLSVGVFENQRLIAFILHGFDIIDNQKVAYNGGTGVIPEKRGSGLTKKMYEACLPILEQKGIDIIFLEVITQNIQAIRSYEKIGFKTTRTLGCFKGNFKPIKSYQIADIKEQDLYEWNLMESFWDINPTWQNSKNVLNRSKLENDSFGAYIDNQLVAYVIYNSKSRRIQQIAVHKEYRKRGIGTKLISELAKKHGNWFSIINVDKKAKNVTNFFNLSGFENYIDQIEMELKLSKNSSKYIV